MRTDNLPQILEFRAQEEALSHLERETGFSHQRQYRRELLEVVVKCSPEDDDVVNIENGELPAD